MRITFNQINALGITPAECVEWARAVITHKSEYQSPCQNARQYQKSGCER